MESPSDSVNGVNADVPLDNDGGEKLVGALLVDDYGPIEHIIPFPFDVPVGRRRKKRDAHKCVKMLSLGTSAALFLSAIFSTAVFFMNKHIKKEGHSKSQTLVGYKKNYIIVIILLAFFLLLSIILVSFSFWIIGRRHGRAGVGAVVGTSAGSDHQNDGIELIDHASARFP